MSLPAVAFSKAATVLVRLALIPNMAFVAPVACLDSSMPRMTLST